AARPGTAGARVARAAAASASSAWTRSPGCGRETSLARMAADRVIFMAMAASPASVACRARTAGPRRRSLYGPGGAAGRSEDHGAPGGGVPGEGGGHRGEAAGPELGDLAGPG